MNKKADAAMAKHGLRPLDGPWEGMHHTDVNFTKEDREVGCLAYWLGDLFLDKENDDPDTKLKETYWYKEMNPLDTWTRVARALRLHGLKIVNRSFRVPEATVVGRYRGIKWRANIVT